MKERRHYEGFQDFKNQNYEELKSDYDSCEDERKTLYENPTFDDYCIAQWQWLN